MIGGGVEFCRNMHSMLCCLLHLCSCCSHSIGWSSHAHPAAWGVLCRSGVLAASLAHPQLWVWCFRLRPRWLRSRAGRTSADPAKYSGAHTRSRLTSPALPSARWAVEFTFALPMFSTLFNFSCLRMWLVPCATSDVQTNRVSSVHGLYASEGCSSCQHRVTPGCPSIGEYVSQTEC